MDSAHVSSAWMRPRISSYQGIPVLRRPCSNGLECGFQWITCGESAGTCLTVKKSSKKPHASLPGKKRPRTKPLHGVWKARSVFWDLPYWKYLHTPHSLDMMHIMKKVCESLLGTLLNMPERTKDGPKARSDLELLGIKKELHGSAPDEDDDDDEMGEDTQGHRKRAKRRDVVFPAATKCATDIGHLAKPNRSPRPIPTATNPSPRLLLLRPRATTPAAVLRPPRPLVACC